MRAKAELEMIQLQRAIVINVWAVAGISVVVLAFYTLWFWWGKSLPLSDDPGRWGQFGDFLGGLINPLIAFSAFYWLTRSVGIQKAELSETKRALEEAAKAQAEQARATDQTVMVAALSARLDAISADIELMTTNIQFFTNQFDPARPIANTRVIGRDGEFVSGMDAIKRIGAFDEKIQERIRDRNEIEESLKSTLERWGSRQIPNKRG